MNAAIKGLIALVVVGWASAATAEDLTRTLVHVAFTEAERQVMERYFDDTRATRQQRTDKKDKGAKGNKGNKGRQGLPPGLAKKGELPPGLAKKAVLPPGLDRSPLPADLVRRLPPLDASLDRAIVAGSVVLIEKATGTVLDILEHVATAD